MNALQRMIAEAKAEHDAMWAVAIAGNRQVHAWASHAEAQAANPGFSFYCFAQGADGMWRIA